MDVQSSIFQHILDNISESVYWMDTDGKIIGCNKKQLELFGLSHVSELIGKNIFDVARLLDWSESIPQQIRENDLKILTSRKELVTEEIVVLNGEERIFLVHKEPWIDDISQAVVGIIGMAFDITEYKKSEVLRKKNEVAHDIIQKLKTIAGSLSHEIRTPLAGVRTGLSLLKTFFHNAKQDPTQVTQEMLEQQEQWVVRLIERIDSGNALITMQLKNMTAGQINTGDFVEGCLTRWVKHAIATFPFENKALAQKVHVVMPESLPIIGDPLLTCHLLWNLLNNACHFIKETERGDIRIQVENTHKYHVLRFKDTAKGMSPEQALQVFEQFYTKRKEGCGLGLHFCRLVMEAYQGRIECRAEEGQYTEFLLFFPRQSQFMEMQPQI